MRCSSLNLPLHESKTLEGFPAFRYYQLGTNGLPEGVPPAPSNIGQILLGIRYAVKDMRLEDLIA